MRPTRLFAAAGFVLASLAVGADPATALSCLRPPDNVAEVTITGEIPDEGWYGDAEVPVVVGRVVEGTAAQPEAAGDRLALVEVIGGFRLDSVPSEIEIVADDLVGWGHPTYSVEERVFLRLDEWNVVDGDPAGGVAVGPCSWNDRYSTAEIESLLELAEEHEVPLVTPLLVVEDEPVESTTSTTTVAPTTTRAEAPVDDAEPIATTEDTDDGLSTVFVVALAIAALVVLGAASFVISSRR